MKTYKWFFLVLVSGVLVTCTGTSEEELIGDWQRRAVFNDVPRSHAATFVIGDKGYVCCGWSGRRERRNDVFVFDHTLGDGQGSWGQKLGDFPGMRRSHAVGFSVGRFGYIGTGYDGDETDMNDFWRYDPDRDEWTEVAPLPSYSRRGAIAFSLFVGDTEYGFVGFGLHDGPLDRLWLADLWQFDPNGTTIDEDGNTFDGSWKAITGYGGAKREGATVFVIDNKAYISSGKHQNGHVNEFWIFDPNSAKNWITNPPRPMWDSNPDEDYDDDYIRLPRAYGVSYVVSVNGQLRGHIVGGDTNSALNWEYDHENDLWIQRTQFINHQWPNSREGMVSFSFPSSGRAFVGMGQSGNSYHDDIWEFIPLIDDYTYNDR